MYRKGRGRAKGINKKDFDDQFEAFLKDSMSSEDSINSAKINKYLEAPSKSTSSRPWWDVDDNSDKGASKSFLKKSTGPKDAVKKSGESPKLKPRKDALKSKSKAEVSLSKDSLDDISERSEEDRGGMFRPRVHVPEESMDSIDTEELLNNKTSGNRVGMDTLDELADKEIFFRDLENNADCTVDYGRLNQELSATGNTLSPEGAARTAATLAAIQDIDYEDEEDVPPHPMHKPDHLLSERDHSEQKPSMLSKVSLMDSLESTMNTTTSPQVGKRTLEDARDILEERDEEEEQGLNFRPSHSGVEMLKTTTGMMGTNTSHEIEALQKALEKVGLSATIGNDSQLELSSQTADARGAEDLVKKLLNTDSGKQRNVADILRELEELQNKVGDSPRTAGNRRSASPNSTRSSLERQPHVEQDDYDEEDLRGFNLSPAHPYTDPDASHRGDYSQRGGGDHSQKGGSSSNRGGDSSYRGGFDTSHTEDTEMYRPVIEVSEDPAFQARQSVKERSRSKKKERKAEERRKKHERAERADKQHKDNRNNSSLQRSRSSSPLKIDFSETLKWKHKTIKGSGYGQAYTPPKPPRDRSRDHEREILGYMRSTKASDRKQNTQGTGELPTKSPTKPGPGLSGTTNVSPKKTDVSPKRKETMKGSNSAWSPAEVPKQRVKGSQSLKQAKLGTVASSHLEASVESFAQYIKEHFAGKQVAVPKTSADEPTLAASFKEKDHSIGDKDQLIASLREEMAAQQRRFERQIEAQKLEYEHLMAELKQENFVLKAKLSGEEGTEIKKKILAGETLDTVSNDQLDLLKRELKEQETLISGYQQENKRLYDEMKNIRKQTKQTEEHMFKENQKLLTDMANLRTQLERKEQEYQNKGLITGPAAQQKIAAGDTQGAITTLQSELSESKRASDILTREMTVLQQSRVELEKHVEALVMERENLKKTIETSKTMKSEEARALEKEYQAEIEKLQKKLKWYTENQELLEKGAKKIKHRDDEIHKLKMRIEELQTESGKRVEDSKVRARERAADSKKIQDLQRQVKEMEAILKRRNPNSIPSLMIAAAAAGETSTTDKRTAYTDVLESRVKKLEKELELKDDDTDHRLRGVEQRYNSVKLQFEERIKELELQLSIYQGQDEHQHPHTHAVALQRELESVRERYKQQVKDLQAETDRLTAELAKSKKVLEGSSSKAELQSVKEAESQLSALVSSLQTEIENKNHELQVMQKSLERLRKEKQISYSTGKGRSKLKGKGSNRFEDSSEAGMFSLPTNTSNNSNNPPKEYEPKTFEDAHISDVLKENEDLKMKVDRQQLQLEQDRVTVSRIRAENEAVLRQTHEQFETSLEQVRASHQNEVKRILAQQALDHSASRVAELGSKVDTQEVMIKHLREQQARLEVEAEAASVLRIKQTRLEESIKSLHRELNEAKKSHTPEMRHFETLQNKIIQIENKHSVRENELQDIIRNFRHTASLETEKEVEKWRQLVDTKNEEISKFRMELDSILEVLRMLHQQGVVIPVGSTAVS